ncbi:hypothetical protein LTR94_035030, partial [Friedmanniomyces endolithicus]
LDAEITDAAQAGETEFGRGALVVPIAGQTLEREALQSAVNQAAREAGVVAHVLATGQSITGVDLGSEQLKPVDAPEIALIMGEGINPAEIG